jgi:NAD(P)-dependent dehydrogenase (short-subunit alcohol dehydrogenase family)
MTDSPSTSDGDRFAGRVALVTGAGGPDTGHQTSRRLLEGGATVVLTDRSERRLGMVASGLAEVHGDRVHSEVLDLRRPDEIPDFVAALQERVGDMDILVNNAAISPIAEMDALKVEEWDDTLNVNLKSPWLLTKHLAEGMKRLGRGSVVNVTSVAAYVAGWREGVYGATKAALHSITRDFAAELGPSGIRVNSVAPGPLDSTWTNEHWDMYEKEAQASALRRLATPTEVANVICWLCSEDSSTVTGQVLNVSNGWHFTP